MDNSVKIEGYDAKVQITEGGAVFVEINGWTVYFESHNSNNDLVAWHESFPEDCAIDLSEKLTLKKKIK